MVTGLQTLDTNLSNLSFSGGNMGIGTVNPRSQLEIALTRTDIAGSGALTLNGTQKYGFRVTSAVPANGFAIDSYNGASWSTPFVIDNVGNIGIGTTSPGALLDIRGSLSAGDSKFYNSVQLTDSFNGATQSWIWAGGSNQLNLGIGGISAGNTKMVIASNGNVMIGTTTDVGYKLDVNGSVRGTSWTASDRNLKKNIQILSGALDKIEELRGVTYEWKDSSKGSGSQVGVIAQEVEQVFPELVNTDKQGMKAVNYSALVAPLIEAVKELSHKLDELFTKYIDQQKEIDSFKTRLDKLEQK